MDAGRRLRVILTATRVHSIIMSKWLTTINLETQGQNIGASPSTITQLETQQSWNLHYTMQELRTLFLVMKLASQGLDICKATLSLLDVYDLIRLDHTLENRYILNLEGELVNRLQIIVKKMVYSLSMEPFQEWEGDTEQVDFLDDLF